MSVNHALRGLACWLLAAAVGAIPLAGQTALWNQLDGPSGDGIPDQDFEAEFDEFDSEAADDFVVDWPDGWGVEAVRTVGDQSLTGHAASVDLSIHADVAGRPAAGAMPGCSHPGLVPFAETDGSFELRLPTPCLLVVGRYWLVLQTNQSFDSSGQHFWSSRLDPRGFGALWRNPLDGFETGCTDWGSLPQCQVGGSFPDLLFALDGALLDPPPVIVDAVVTAAAAGVTPAVSAGPAGVFALAWRREDRVELRRWDDLGRALGPVQQVFKGGGAGAPVVAVDELGAAAVAWARPAGGIQARVYDADGDPTRSAFQVVPTGRRPAIARARGGATAIVWEDGGDGGIFGRVYDPLGNSLGSAIAIDAAGTGREPALAMGRDGLWTAAWRGEDGNLRARTLGPFGGAFGGEGIVAAGLAAEDPAPVVAALGGRLVAFAWIAQGQLRVRRWLVGAGPLGDEVVLAAVAPGEAPFERIAIAGNVFDEVLVTWQRDLGANAHGFARFVGEDGEPIGGVLDLGFGRDDLGVSIDPAGQGRLVSTSSGAIEMQRLALRPADCGEGGVLCVGGASSERFAVRVAWRDFAEHTGIALPHGLTSDTGWFHFFNAENVEVVLKVLDGSSLNGAFWVFYAALSNVEFTVSVVDRESGLAAVYHNPSGNFASVGDTAALPLGGAGVAAAGGGGADPMAERGEVLRTLGVLELEASGAPPKAGPCVASDTVLCLFDGRMELSSTWRDAADRSGVGHAALLAGETTGYFWFFDSDNVELVVKVLDGRPLNGRFWVFYGALTNVEFFLRVRDLVGGGEVAYENPLGTFASRGDTEAL